MSRKWAKISRRVGEKVAIRIKPNGILNPLIIKRRQDLMNADLAHAGMFLPPKY